MSDVIYIEYVTAGVFKPKVNIIQLYIAFERWHVYFFKSKIWSLKAFKTSGAFLI